jgi:hypothetical protein
LQERCGITRDEAEPQAAISKSDARSPDQPVPHVIPMAQGGATPLAIACLFPGTQRPAQGASSRNTSGLSTEGSVRRPFTFRRSGSLHIHGDAANMERDMGEPREPPRREPQHLPPRRQRDPTNQDDIPARRDPERRDRRKKHVERKH